MRHCKWNSSHVMNFDWLLEKTSCWHARPTSTALVLGEPLYLLLLGLTDLLWFVAAAAAAFFSPVFQFLQGRQFAETNMKMAVASSHKHHLTNSQPECSNKNTAVKPVSPVYTDGQVVTELWCVAWGFTAIFSLSGFVINSQGYLKPHEPFSRLEGKEINQIYDFAKLLN